MTKDIPLICVIVEEDVNPRLSKNGIKAAGAHTILFDSAKGWTKESVQKWAKGSPFQFKIQNIAMISSKCYGDQEHPAKKTLVLEGFKATQENGALVIEGYANTKGHPDRYGDVPTVFSALRSYVYDLSDYLENPVLLLNHENNTGAIAGHMLAVNEDDKGLHFKAQFSASDFPPVAHARTVYAEGHARALSIAGKFYYENPDEPDQLTLAKIYEISLVGVGADPQALCTPTIPDEPQRAADIMPLEIPRETKGSISEETISSKLLETIKATTLLTDLKAATVALDKTNPPEAGKQEIK